MYEERLILAQLMDFIPKRDFDDSVNRYRFTRPVPFVMAIGSPQA